MHDIATDIYNYKAGNNRAKTIATDKQREAMNIVITGHVDHGKSTIIGRLLADTDSLPKGKLEQIREICRKNSKPFEYAFLLDALKDEQAQGITIDAARCFFKTQKRDYLIIDAPGHVEFLKNMVTGASRAEAALLVIDAKEGIQENSRRHGYLLSMLGIRQIAVLVNKMDLVGYEKQIFDDICQEYSEFLNEIGIDPYCFIPVSGRMGDNIARVSCNMSWYKGLTVLDVLDEFQNEKPLEDKPFRMPVQGVYKFTARNDTRRIVAGTVETGTIKVGDEVIFYPSGKKSRIASIEGFNQKPRLEIGAGYATGFTLHEQIYIKRGEIMAIKGEAQPLVGKRIRVNLFWLGKKPMSLNKEYILKLGTARTGVTLEKIIRVMDASSLQNLEKTEIKGHDVAECILYLDRPIALDLAEDIPSTGRFVIVDQYEISGGGIVREVLEDEQSWVRNKVVLRNIKWENSHITDRERAEKYNQKATLILLTGEKDVGKKSVAKAVEKNLFNDGRVVYFMGIANMLYGVDADIKGQTSNRREEHFRRLAEVAHLMLDAGCILIVTARELNSNDLDIIRTVIEPHKIRTIWIGKNITTDIDYDLHIPAVTSIDEASNIVKNYLRDEGIVFKPW